MQRIERYGVIALVFLLVTIVAVSLWGERKPGPGLLTLLGKDSRSAKVEELVANASSAESLASDSTAARSNVLRTLPLSEPELPATAPRSRGPAPRLPEETAPAQSSAASAASILPSDPAELSEHSSSVRAAAPEKARGQPESSERTYTVKRGDTLSEIAERELGTQSRWRELVALNPGLDPQRLKEGQRLRIAFGPPARIEPAAKPAAEPPPQLTQVAQVAQAAPPAKAQGKAKRYTVRPGDTLSEIAARELGSTRRWSEIVELNPGLAPRRLLAGQELQIPAGEPSAAAAGEQRLAKAEVEPAPAKAASASRSKVR